MDAGLVHEILPAQDRHGHVPEFVDLEHDIQIGVPVDGEHAKMPAVVIPQILRRLDPDGMLNDVPDHLGRGRVSDPLAPVVDKVL